MRSSREGMKEKARRRGERHEDGLLVLEPPHESQDHQGDACGGPAHDGPLARTMVAPAIAPACSPSAPASKDDGPGHPAIEIAIYPDVVWLAARSLRAQTRHPPVTLDRDEMAHNRRDERRDHVSPT
jgi:hypothetical protein